MAKCWIFQDDPNADPSLPTALQDWGIGKTVRWNMDKQGIYRNHMQVGDTVFLWYPNPDASIAGIYGVGKLTTTHYPCPQNPKGGDCTDIRITFIMQKPITRNDLRQMLPDISILNRPANKTVFPVDLSECNDISTKLSE